MLRHFLSAVALALLAAPALAADKPNIVLIFSDDHAYQAISAYGDPRKLIDTPNIDRIAKEGMRFDRCLVPNSHLRAEPGHDPDRQVFAPQRLLQQHQQPVRRHAGHVPEAAPEGRLPDRDHRQVAPRLRPDRVRPLAHPARPGAVLQPADDQERRAGAAPGLRHRPDHRLQLDWLKNRDKTKPFLLMSQHKAPHREWSPALRHLGHDKDRKYPEPETLFDDYANRGPAVKDQDMTLAKTFTATRRQARPAARHRRRSS